MLNNYTLMNRLRHAVGCVEDCNGCAPQVLVVFIKQINLRLVKVVLALTVNLDANK
jgi:hypothetical protein